MKSSSGFREIDFEDCEVEYLSEDCPECTFHVSGVKFKKLNDCFGCNGTGYIYTRKKLLTIELEEDK